MKTFNVMKVYKKKNSWLKVLSERKSGRFGGTEVVFLNGSKLRIFARSNY